MSLPQQITASCLIGLCLCLMILLCRPLLSQGNSPGSDIDWAQPGAMALKQVSATAEAQVHPVLQTNLDCQLITYKVIYTNTLVQGCVAGTAFGFEDLDNLMVLFADADRAVPLLSYSHNDVLMPWPGTEDMLALASTPTGGSYISLYTSVLGTLKDVRDPLGEVTAKQVSGPPDIRLSDASGAPLVVAPQSMAFSSNSSWLVVETLNGSFVRINLASLQAVPFASGFYGQGDAQVGKVLTTVSDDGRFVAIGNNTSQNLRIYDLSNCSSTTGVQRCAYYDYWPFLSGQLGQTVTLSDMSFVNEGLLRFTANGAIYELAPASSITSTIDYLALGDSYTSGEGAYAYAAGTDTDTNHCHLSINAYPALLTRDLFSAAGGHSVACSGAQINDVASTSANYVGQVAGGQSYQTLHDSQPAFLQSIETNFTPGYIAQQRFVGLSQPRIITLMVGGDDMSFGDILERCVGPQIGHGLDANTCFDTYEDRLELQAMIDKTVPKLVSAYSQVKKQAPGARLYIIGYPQIASDQGSCALNVHLSKSELEFAEELVDYMNGAVQQAASQAKLQYVDISHALDGHRLCEAASYDVAVNGLTFGNGGGILGVNFLAKESYHPTQLGHELIEQAILRATSRLTIGGNFVAVASNPAAGSFIKGTKTGRSTTNLQIKTVTTKKVPKAKATAVHVSGKASGIAPSKTYTIHLDGTSGPILASGTSSTTGDIDTSVIIDTNTGGDTHTIDVVTTDETGQPTDVSQTIYVVNSPDDADGDGIPDNVDSCPYGINSAVDSDQDGVDDACDPFIGLSGGSSSATTTPGSATGATSTSSSTDVQPASGTGDVQGGTSYGDLPEDGSITATIYAVTTSVSGVTQASQESRTLGVTAAAFKVLIPSGQHPHSFGSLLERSGSAILPGDKFVKLPRIEWLVWAILVGGLLVGLRLVGLISGEDKQR